MKTKGIWCLNKKFKPCPFCGNASIGYVPHVASAPGMKVWLVKCLLCPAQMIVYSACQHVSTILSMWNNRRQPEKSSIKCSVVKCKNTVTPEQAKLWNGCCEKCVDEGAAGNSKKIGWWKYED